MCSRPPHQLPEVHKIHPCSGPTENEQLGIKQFGTISPRRQNFIMAEVVKTAITVNQCMQESFAGLSSYLHIPSSLTFALHMTYWLNNPGIISPHHTFVLRVRYNVIPGIFMLTLLSF